MKFVPLEFFKKSKRRILKDLDILICKDGALTGKIALFEKEKFPYEKGMINEHVFILRTKEIVTQKYLFYLLYSQKGQEILKANVTGAAQGGLNKTNLINIKVPNPSFGVQQNIVKEIEELKEKSKTIVIKDIGEKQEYILNKYLQ